MVKFAPIDLLNKKIEVAKEDSDTAMFMQLMYSAEQLVKIVTSGLLACIDDDKQRHRYSQEYRLVRADGIGEWSSCLDEILSGPTSQFLNPQAREIQKEFLEAKKEGTWQYDSIKLLNSCLKIVDPKADVLPVKTQGRNWYSLFARLRNKTRGHGALGSETCSKLCPLLHDSIALQINNQLLLKMPWAFVKRNLNGKYRVSTISHLSDPFEHLKRDKKFNISDGVYLHIGNEHRFVKLIISSPELEDFYFPNGAFGNKTYECLSYISDNKIQADVTPFLIPAGELPKSQTDGLGNLEIIGDTFTNLPDNKTIYIKREQLEDELKEKLFDERHPVITLVGRGGIGKTSLALSVLGNMCYSNKFAAIIWLSARDIDLFVEGAKPVKPRVLTVPDIAKEFTALMGEKNSKTGETEKRFMESELTKSSFGPILFVLDNFETMVNPKEVYSWLNTFIRLPNKILITSRFRDFKGDYPIEVHGMNEPEFRELIEKVSNEIGIPDIIHDENYMQELYSQSDGHPYVAKILLGERQKEGKTGNIKAILAGKDDVLTALFERTYANLSPIAKRVFLTASNWRSTIPELALQAILIRSEIEPGIIEEAIEELTKSSLVETIRSAKDDSYFISVPLSAALFGKRKLSVDPMKIAIEADTSLLHSFGAGTVEDVKFGINPRIDRLFSEVAKRIGAGKASLDDYVPTLDFVCRKHRDSWLTMASLFEEENNQKGAISSIQNFLEAPTTSAKAIVAWKRLARLYELLKDWQGQAHALVELSLYKDVPFSDLSNSANALSKLYNENKLWVDAYEKRLSIEKVITAFENRIFDEGDATDYSRLAWLYMQLNDLKNAKQFVEAGLGIDPQNIYCLRLLKKLK